MRQWLKNMRLKKNMRQREVAEKSGITRCYYTLIENGNRTPKPEHAQSIAKALDFDWTIFFVVNSCESSQIPNN